MEKIIIGIVGMPGAGKGIVKEVAYQHGFPVIVMGDEVRAEAKRRNIESTPENLGRLMLEIRAEEGPEAIARRCIPKIKMHESPIVVIEGLRSLHEVKEFQKEFPNFKIVAIHASPKTRFRRLLARGRSDDPKNWETFYMRDQRELKVGIGEVIALADYMIVNEGSIECLKKEFEEILEKVMGDEQPRRKSEN